MENSFAQDELLFLNGKELKGEILNVTNYEITFKDLKGKEMVIDNYRVFSYHRDNKETLTYKYDTLEGNFLKEQDMRMFVYGEKDAYKSYHSRFSNTMGFAAGGIAGYFMHKEQAFIYSVAPLVYTSVTLIFPTSVKQKRLNDLQYLKEEEYLRGHERVARSKRTQNALKSSFIGMGAGFLISFLVNGNSN
ncbi:MAG: hypothetical protein AB7O47_11450 [Flavobacteriales bacterium]